MDSAIDNRCWNDVYVEICALKTKLSNGSTSNVRVQLFGSANYRVVLEAKSTGSGENVYLSLWLKYDQKKSVLLADLGRCLIKECSEEHMQKNPLFSRLCIYAFLVVTHKDTVDSKIQVSNQKISEVEKLPELKIERKAYKQAFNILFYAVCHSRLIHHINQENGIDHRKELKESTDKMLQEIGLPATVSLMKFLASLRVRILSKDKSARMDGLIFSYSSTKANSWLIRCYCSKMEGKIYYGNDKPLEPNLSHQMLQCVLLVDNTVTIKEDCIEVELKVRRLSCNSLKLDSSEDQKKGRYFPAEITLTMWPECDFGFSHLLLLESSPNPSTTVCKTRSAETGLQLRVGSGASLTVVWNSNKTTSSTRTNENWWRGRSNPEVKKGRQAWILCNHSNGKSVLDKSDKKNNYKAFKDLAQSDRLFTPDGGINFEKELCGQSMMWSFDRRETNLEWESLEWSVEVEIRLACYDTEYMETRSQKFHEHVQLSLVQPVKHSSLQQVKLSFKDSPSQQVELSLVQSVKDSSLQQAKLSLVKSVKHSSPQQVQLSFKESSSQQVEHSLVQSVKDSSPQQAQLSSVKSIKQSSPQQVQLSFNDSSPQPVEHSLVQFVKDSSPQQAQLSSLKSVKDSSPQQAQHSLVKYVKHSSPQQAQLSLVKSVKHSSPQQAQLSLVKSVKHSSPQQAQLSLVKSVKHSSPQQAQLSLVKSVKHSSPQQAQLSLAQPVKHSSPEQAQLSFKDSSPQQVELSINASPPQLTSVQSNMGLDKWSAHLKNVYGWICGLKTELNDGNTSRLELLELSSGKKIALCAKLTGKHGPLSLRLETVGEAESKLNEKCSKKDMEKNLHPLFSRLCIYAFLGVTVKDIVDLKILESEKISKEEIEELLRLQIEPRVYEQAFNILFYVVCHFRLGHRIKQVKEIDYHKELKELTDKMLQVIGPAATESLMKSLAYLRILSKEIGARKAGLKISYSSRLAIHCYCPCPEMRRERPYGTISKSLEDALNHQLLQCMLRLDNAVNIEGDCIEVKLKIVYLRCKSLQLYSRKDQKRERHFPAMISVTMWPECNFECNNLSLGETSSNPSASVSKTQKNEVSVQGQLSSLVMLSLKDKRGRTTSSTSKNWRRTTRDRSGAAIEKEWTLYNNSNTERPKKENKKSNTERQRVLDYRIYCNDHLRRAHKDFKSLTGVGSDGSFTEDGGINFEGEEMCGPPMTWSFNRNLEGKSLKWSVEIEISLAYFDTECMEIRYHKFGEQVELPLV